MKRKSFIEKSRNWCGLLLLLAMPVFSIAQPLEDIGLEYGDQGVVATIRFSAPIQYLRHYPESHGNTLEIFYDRVPGATDNETWVDNEVRQSPRSGLIPSFSVTTRDQKVSPKLVVEFSREAEYSVAMGKDQRSLLVTIRPDKRQASSGPLPLLPTIKPEAKPLPNAVLSADEAAMAEYNTQGRALMIQGRDALDVKNNEAALDALNKLLLLPPNDYTQDAQEWVGVARERAGQIDKAKIEYDLYLRLYPDSEGAGRVVQRLNGLAGKSTAKAAEATGEEKKRAARWMTVGSVSSRYYFGSSKIDSTFTFNNATTSSSLSLTDQSMLISNVDVSERYISDEYDGRVVFREANTRNFLSNQPSLNRVSAAYGEIKNRTQNYMLRVGRQSAMGGGVLGRFDGVAGSLGDAQELKINGVVGSLADYSKGTKPFFFGAGYEFGPYSLYAINQSADGILDRRAVGSEWRYYEGKNSAYALVDYDTYFKALNAAQLMGTLDVTNATVSFMIDRRKAPSLSVRNALIGAGTSSISALLQTMSANSVRDLALARTATSTMSQVGVSIPFRDKWQVGGDVRLTNTTGLAASGINPANNGGIISPEGFIAATSGRGSEKSVTALIVGSNLLDAGDVWSLSATLASGSAVSSHRISLYNHEQFNSGWMMDSSLNLYAVSDQFGGTTKYMSPTVRGSYRLKDSLTFDVDGGLENINYNGASQTSKTMRFYYSAGLRWDF